MITIVKGNNKNIVTRGLYESIYKPLGYIILEEEPKDSSKKKQNTKNELESSEVNVKNTANTSELSSKASNRLADVKEAIEKNQKIK